MTVKEIGMETPRSTRNAYLLVIWLMSAMLLFFSASFCMAQNDLVRLVQPDAPVIAGLHRMSQDRSKDALWVATRNSVDDLSRLVALVENDPERRVDQVIVADWGSSTSSPGSHLVIAQGRFNLASIASTMAHPAKLSYDGVPVLAIETKAGSTPAMRWLAVPQRELALFGTPSAVQVALDRFRSGAHADPQLLERLRNAHDRDAAWSSVVLAPRALQASGKFQAGALAPCLDRMREVDLGIQIGKTVTIDLHTEPRDGAAGVSAECISTALFANYAPLMRIGFGGGERPDVRVTLVRSDYERWLDPFRKSELKQTLAALLSAPGGSADPAPDNVESVR